MNTQQAYRKTPIFVAPNIHIQTRNILLPICNNITFKKQKPYFCTAKTILLHAKNHTFARQKGGFYTPKNPFLFFVSITNTLLMCYEYSVKWLRTPTKCPTNAP